MQIVVLLRHIQRRLDKQNSTPTKLAAPCAWIREELKNTIILEVQYFSILNLFVEKN